jgi:hypothetical protein
MTLKMTLDPAQADAKSLITVTISLLNYPAVFMTQNITAVVDGGKTAAIVTEAETNPRPCIPSQILDTTINKEVFLELPVLPETSYSVTSKQEFEVTIDYNILKALSKSESDVGTKYLRVSLNSPNLNCTSQVKI